MFVEGNDNGEGEAGPTLVNEDTFLHRHHFVKLIRPSINTNLYFVPLIHQVCQQIRCFARKSLKVPKGAHSGVQNLK